MLKTYSNMVTSNFENLINEKHISDDFMIKMAAFKNKNWIVTSHSATKSDFYIEFVEVDFFVVQENSKSKESSASWQAAGKSNYHNGSLSYGSLSYTI